MEKVTKECNPVKVYDVISDLVVILNAKLHNGIFWCNIVAEATMQTRNKEFNTLKHQINNKSCQANEQTECVAKLE